MPPFSPRDATNSAPFLLRDSAPPGFVSAWTIVAKPVAGSSFITLLASLLAKSTVPVVASNGPSALLPSQAHDLPVRDSLFHRHSFGPL
jgi:hypothetical protein